MAVRVQSADFDLGAEMAAFVGSADNPGAVVSFTGLVRDTAQGLEFMEIEHYPGMTQSAIEAIEAEAVARWELAGSLVIHRFGQLETGAQIMMVATAAAHRRSAFEAAEFLMDFLKSRAPFWKKEVSTSGETWVAAKDDDEAALKRW